MKYVCFELRKIFGAKYVWIIAAAMLALNCAVALYTANETKKNEMIPSDVAVDFFKLCADDSDTIRENYIVFMKNIAGQQSGGGDGGGTPTSNTYSDTYPDMLFYALLNSTDTSFRTYGDDIEDVIKTAETNLYELDFSGTPHGSYAYRNQSEVIRAYTEARNNVRIGFEYPHGWGEYFAYDAVNIFILIVTLTAASTVFTSELGAGILPVIRATRRGRGTTAAAKIAALTAVSAAVALIFALSTFAIFGISFGYSSPYNAIQVISGHRLDPHVISVGEYFAITLLLQVLSAVLLSLSVLAVSVVFGHFAATYIFGLAVIGVSFLLNGIFYNHANAAVRYFNIIATMNADGLFERYRSVNVFGFPVEYPIFIAAVFLLLSVLLAAVFALVYSRASSAERFGAHRAFGRRLLGKKNGAGEGI